MLDKRLKSLCMQEGAMVIQQTDIYNQLNCIDKTNMKHNSYFIEFIPHWSLGDQKDVQQPMR